MDLQDHTIIPSSGQGHGHDHEGVVHLCHRCGWPFPNPHPSAKHRRSHKKICGTIHGYTNLTALPSLSDDDELEDKTPSPSKIEKSLSRSEDEMFSDAVTEFSDSVNKSLDKDVFFSFKDASGSGTNEEINKVDTECEMVKAQMVLSKPELTDTDAQRSDVVMDPTPEPSYVSQSQEVESIEVVEAKDSELSKTIPHEVSKGVGGYDDNINIKQEKLTADGISEEEEIKTVSEIVKDSETVEAASEEIKHEKESSDIAPLEGVGEHENISVLNKQSQEADASLTEKEEDLVLPELENASKEQIQQVVKESATKEEDFGEQPILNEPDSVLEELDVPPILEKCSAEQILQEIIKEPNNNVLTEKQDQKQEEDLDVSPILEKESQPGSVLTQKQEEELDVPPVLEKGSKEVIERKVDDDVSNVTLKDTSDNSIDSGNKNASGVEEEEEGNGKLINNQDSSSRNSLEGNWGSVSVLSTASMDAETLHSTEKSKVNSMKSSAADSHSTLVKPKVKDEKSEAQNSESEEGRKRNEEVIAKVTNWSTTGKQSTPLKNLLGEAKSPSGKEPVVVVVEKADEKAGEVSSPPKLIDDGKKGKKVKGRSSWVPFVCCSSVNVVN